MRQRVPRFVLLSRSKFKRSTKVLVSLSRRPAPLTLTMDVVDELNARSLLVHAFHDEVRTLRLSNHSLRKAGIQSLELVEVMSLFKLVPVDHLMSVNATSLPKTGLEAFLSVEALPM